MRNDGIDVELFDDFDVSRITRNKVVVNQSELMKVSDKYGINSKTNSRESMDILLRICEQELPDRQKFREKVFDTNAVTKKELVELSYLIEICAQKMRNEIDEYLETRKVSGVVDTYSNYSSWRGSWGKVAMYLSTISSSAKMVFSTMLPVMELYWEDELRSEDQKVLTGSDMAAGQLDNNSIESILSNYPVDSDEFLRLSSGARAKYFRDKKPVNN